MRSFVEINPLVLEKTFERFLPIKSMDYLYTHCPPSYRCFILNMALINQAVSEKKMFEYYGNIHLFCPEVGADEPLGSNVFKNH